MTLSTSRGPSAATESVHSPENDKRARMLEAQHVITGLLANPKALEDSAPELLQALCRATDAGLGILWSADSKAQVMRFSAGWSSFSKANPFDRGQNFQVHRDTVPAGQAWITRKPVTVEDLHDEPLWKNHPLSELTNSRSMVALPVLDGQDVAVIVELLGSQAGALHPEVGAFLFSIAGQLSQHCEQKRTAEELRRSRERFELAMMGSGDGIWDWDVLTNEVYFSPNWKSCLGYAEHEIASSFDEWEKRIHPDDRDRALAAIRAYFRGETPSYALEHRLQHKDGSYRLVLARGVALRDGQGRPYRMSGSHTDITQLKADQIALRDSEALYHSLVETLPLNVLRKDKEGRFTFGNQLFCKTLSKPLAQIVGKTDYDFYPRELADKYRQDDQRVVDERVILETIEEHRKPNGEMIYVQVLKTPVYDSRGKVVGTQAFFWDVSERKRAEQQMQRAKEEAESASRSKSFFLANMSHEIRTPMNAIIGMTELMLSTQLTVEQREYLNLIRKSAELLLSVINDILDFSKVEAGKLDLDIVEFGLRETLGDLLNTLAPRAHQKGLELACHVAPDTPDLLQGDPSRLGQIILNLVGNAIKFTDQGEVVVRVERMKDEGGTINKDRDAADVSPQPSALILFSVSDTGIGVPQEKSRAIFEAFAQGDGSTTRRYGGTGLGLAIAKRLVELLGGNISVESRSGQGSTFRFSARFGLSEARSAPADAKHAGGGTVPIADEYAVATSGGDRQKASRALRVLLAEDNLVNQQLVARLLQRRGHKVVVVNTGQEALEAYDLLPFDVVLMDVQMPEMDGLEATAEIRRREAVSGKHVPIVALTAYAMKGDRESCLTAGMDRYISKPIRARDLFEAVEGDLSGPDGSGDEQSSQPHESGDVIDRAGALSRVGNNLNLLSELAAIFLKEYPRILDEIRAGLAAGDARRTGGATHSLKGAIDNFAARPSFEAALRLETLCRNGNLVDARTVLADLERELNRLQPVLSRLAAGRY